MQQRPDGSKIVSPKFTNQKKTLITLNWSVNNLKHPIAYFTIQKNHIQRRKKKTQTNFLLCLSNTRLIPTHPHMGTRHSVPWSQTRCIITKRWLTFATQTPRSHTVSVRANKTIQPCTPHYLGEWENEHLACQGKLQARECTITSPVRSAPWVNPQSPHNVYTVKCCHCRGKRQHSSQL